MSLMPLSYLSHCPHHIHGCFYKSTKPTEANHKIEQYHQQPLQQGHLDGLCGIYSLINAARLVQPSLRPKSCQKLFNNAIHWLHDKKALPSVLHEGMNANILMSLHKRVIQSNLPHFKLKRPFLRKTPHTPEEFWNSLQQLSQSPQQTLLIGIENKNWSHWSVIREITLTRVMLFDSDNLYYLQRRNCACLGLEEQITHGISPTAVFLITNNQNT